MRKKTLLLGTCLCVALSLAACGNKNSGSGKEEATPSVTGEATPSVTDEATPDPTQGAQEEAQPTLTVANNVEVTLGQYKGIEVTMLPVEVTEEEIQSAVDTFNEHYGVAIPVKDKSVVESGDTVNIDYTGKMDGEEFAGGKDTDTTLTIGSNSFIPGFEDGLIGKKVGETVDINLTFPENYGAQDLAGKPAVFTVTINYIDSGEKEPITDEVIAKNDQNGNKTVEEYREFIRTNLTKSKEANAESQKQMDIMNAAIDNATFAGDIQVEIDSVKDQLKASFEQSATQYGLDLQTYIQAAFGGMTMDQFEEEVDKAANFKVRQKYLLLEISEQEKIDLSQEEYDKAVADYMKQYNYAETDKEKFETDNGGKELVRQTLLLEKVRDIVLESAVVKEN
ncbi:MAG: trigger factor [Clostridiales bacterium]|nr:trigger factor [Clostridiales bacterium]